MNSGSRDCGQNVKSHHNLSADLSESYFFTPLPSCYANHLSNTYTSKEIEQVFGAQLASESNSMIDCYRDKGFAGWISLLIHSSKN
jgi:hypothetical protein